jgi:hypothetical protein
VSRAVRYAAAALGAAVLVTLVALAVAPAADRHGVFVGAGLALVVQVALVVTLHAALPDRRLLAVGLAMLGRFAAFGVVALVVLLAPGAGLPAAATLLTLVAVFLVVSILEPVFFRPEPLPRS